MEMEELERRRRVDVDAMEVGAGELGPCDRWVIGRLDDPAAILVDRIELTRGLLLRHVHADQLATSNELLQLQLTITIRVDVAELAEQIVEVDDELEQHRELVLADQAIAAALAPVS